jgi:hypothetical protein
MDEHQQKRFDEIISEAEGLPSPSIEKERQLRELIASQMMDFLKDKLKTIVEEAVENAMKKYYPYQAIQDNRTYSPEEWERLIRQAPIQPLRGNNGIGGYIGESNNYTTYTANTTSSIDNQAYTLLLTRPSNPVLGDMYQDVNYHIHSWVGDRWVDMSTRTTNEELPV